MTHRHRRLQLIDKLDGTIRWLSAMELAACFSKSDFCLLNPDQPLHQRIGAYIGSDGSKGGLNSKILDIDPVVDAYLALKGAQAANLTVLP